MQKIKGKKFKKRLQKQSKSITKTYEFAILETERIEKTRKKSGVIENFLRGTRVFYSKILKSKTIKLNFKL
ncbi:hypothetical protein LEP1GSC016_0168 [Leptospira borgpetersenii serovar Hardjo-bovis str. Sponselee]|uniref:Uncharacterized protein n=1 Tax=Leptospira borgpetersenii serovar Hardjo-bovis str. Sponselee TaxID=1303729 RepID=M6BE03_LEPBO|nr:hypothetical protein LBK6_04570 [Leptospira borgpetersenii serovar Hardjo]AWV69540.1 hypothetical protein B9T54_04975 [Leptospira borgpetersenii serovar Hardjo-bovis]EMJ77759.1 hypothetical protein LEP1GSC016_0168 [Leptospira borgpetersenii serovar Hardjo-bovis str. Sponselee]TQE49856.1 hypothetical protein FFZ95_17890 [Leptospira borgpetersenii]AMX60890.1 hypothetical protein LBK9_04510 [Leptospira borgpetersenii serovar Hardjo]